MLPSQLLNKYRKKGVLVDANLLIGFLIGTLGTQHLHDCRATKNFTPDDFSLLARFLSQFKLLVTTPHILTEVSNLAGKLPETLHLPFRKVFRLMIERLSEESMPSRMIGEKEEFLRFGITDTAISIVAPGRYLVLTDELPLAGLLSKRGVHVVNFNHLRFMSW